MKIFFGSMKSRRVPAPLGADRSTRRTATVTMSAPEASWAARMISCVGYFPVPTIRREANRRPRMEKGGVVAVSVIAPSILSANPRSRSLRLPGDGRGRGWGELVDRGHVVRGDHLVDLRPLGPQVLEEWLGLGELDEALLRGVDLAGLVVVVPADVGSREVDLAQVAGSEVLATGLE